MIFSVTKYTIVLYTLIFGCLVNVALCWEEKDIQIFQMIENLRDVLQDPKADFYSVLGVSPTAPIAEIVKAHRRLSLEYHPDKNETPKAEKLYALLTTIISILKEEGERAHYDSHLKRGFPVWKGTGYFYQRYQPGVLEAILIILSVISVAQYITAWVFYYRARAQEQASAESLNKLSFTQVKKQLKKKGGVDSPKLSKKDFKNAGSAADLLLAGQVEKAQPPQVTDLVILQFPVLVFKGVKQLISKKSDSDTSSEPSATKKQD